MRGNVLRYGIPALCFADASAAAPKKPIIISYHLPFIALRADDDLANKKSQAICFLWG